MEIINNIPAFYARSRQEWREWLELYGAAEKAVWVVLNHKSNPAAGIGYNDAVAEALCFGWIDAKALKRNANSYYLYFTPRRPKSSWSKPNRERVVRLIAEGKMTPSGAALVAHAKENGKWE